MIATRALAAVGAWAGAVILLWLAACGRSITPSDVVAELGDRALSHAAFEEFLERNSVEGAGVLSSEVLSALLDQFLEEQLLARLAVDRLALADTVEARDAALALLQNSLEPPDEAAVRRFYRDNLSRFDLPEEIHLRQLLFAERGRAAEIRESWSGGVPYDTLVERLSGDPQAHAGQEGRFTREELPPVFAETLFSLTEGEVSEVLPVEYGFHVFQVVRRWDAGVAPFDTVSDSIRQELSSRQHEEASRRLVAEARQRYNVRVFERNLPFNYRGRYGSNDTHENL